MNKLPDYEAARDALLNVVTKSTPASVHTTNPTAGQVTATDVCADRDLPPFHRAQMDGYALRATDLTENCALPVVGAVFAGQAADISVPPGACVRIATGAPLPDDVDTVVQHELTDRNDPVRFTIAHIDAGHAVHPRRADAQRGDVVIKTNTRLRPHHLGILASVGITELDVVKQPTVSIVTSGDEVLPPTDAVQPHQIRNSNQPMLASLCTAMGAGTIHGTHVSDDRDATINAMRHATSTSDIVLTVGGVSAGERDFFPDAFDTLGMNRLIAGAAIQPGKPVAAGVLDDDTVIIALPGNPVSALACACLFVWPVIRVRTGLSPALPWRTLTNAATVKPNPRRRAFRPAIVQEDGVSVVVPTWAGSGDLVHTAPTDGLVRLPVQEQTVNVGEELAFLPWPGTNCEASA